MDDAHDFTIDGPAGKLAVRTRGWRSDATDLVVLVQGANMSGQMGYDFQMPGRSDYSMMSALCAAGFATLTFSVRGYGASDGPENPFDVQTDAAIEDLGAVVAWVGATTGKRPHLLGWSWGGRIVGRYVEESANAARVDRIVLLDPALGGGNKILPAPTDPIWLNTYDYFKDRLVAEYSEPEVRELLARRMSQHELRSPNGIRLENANGSKPVDPTRITRPTLMQYGDKAGAQNYMQGGWDRLDFFRALPVVDKAFAITPQGGDYAHLELGRKRVFDTVATFLTTAF